MQSRHGLLLLLLMMMVMLAECRLFHTSAQSSEEEEPEPGNCTGKLDVVAVVDGSDGVSPAAFSKVKEALLAGLDTLDLDPASRRLGVILFGNNVTVATELSGDAAVVGNQIDMLRKPNGTAATHLGLWSMIEVFQKQPRRPSVPKVAVVFTGGPSSKPDLTRRKAKKAKRMGISVFAVGLGSGVDERELRRIASSPQQVALVPDIHQLPEQARGFAEMLCAGNVKVPRGDKRICKSWSGCICVPRKHSRHSRLGRRRP